VEAAVDWSVEVQMLEVEVEPEVDKTVQVCCPVSVCHRPMNYTQAHAWYNHTTVSTHKQTYLKNSFKSSLNSHSKFLFSSHLLCNFQYVLVY